MHNLKIIKEKIFNAQDIIIAGHLNPDGDSIGSLLSLGLGIKKLKKRVYMVCSDELPKNYNFLPGANLIIKRIHKPADLAIAVDCSNKEILGQTYTIFKKAHDILEIDHHEFRRPFGNLRFIDSNAAAVGELIYVLLNKLHIAITKDIAYNLLTSIVVETNSFRLPHVRPFTFEICIELMKLGADFYKLSDMVFWSKSKESVIISGICLSRCKFLKNNRIAWSIVRQKDFNMVKSKDADVDAVADEMRSIKGVEIAVLFREKENNFLRVSLRSKGKINVARIAEYFQGGGHFDIAGCTIPNNQKSMQELLSLASNLLNAHHKEA